MRILMIDNDAQKMSPLQETLKLYGFDVKFCRNVDTAMEYISQHTASIDLILLDIMMPNGNILKDIDTQEGKDTGLHFYKKIREKYQVPIIFYTVVRNKELVKSFVEGDEKADYLTKPQEPDDVVKAIYRLVA